MFYNCECGTSFHISSARENVVLNPVCFNCFKEKQPTLYVVEYDIFPLRAIFTDKVFAQKEEDIVAILEKHKEGRVIIRSIKKD